MKVHLTLSEEDYNLLILALGSACMAYVRTEPDMARRVLDLSQVITAATKRTVEGDS